MKRLLQRCYFGEKGFTLIETLLVLLVVAFVTSLAGLNIAAFVKEVKAESYDFELNNVQTALNALLVESTAGQLDADIVITDDMTLITINDGDKRLNDYMYGLDVNGKIQTGCIYAFTKIGKVTQIRP
jgi:prepilin-type N-terminal cleavage/methylation domain-containing protein